MAPISRIDVGIDIYTSVLDLKQQIRIVSMIFSPVRCWTVRKLHVIAASGWLSVKLWGAHLLNRASRCCFWLSLALCVSTTADSKRFALLVSAVVVLQSEPVDPPPLDKLTARRNITTAMCRLFFSSIVSENKKKKKGSSETVTRRFTLTSELLSVVFSINYSQLNIKNKTFCNNTKDKNTKLTSTVITIMQRFKQKYKNIDRVQFQGLGVR